MAGGRAPEYCETSAPEYCEKIISSTGYGVGGSHIFRVIEVEKLSATVGAIGGF